MLVGGQGPKLQAIGKGSVRDVGQIAPDHREVVADGFEALRLHEAAVVRLDVVDVGSRLHGHVRRLAPRALRRASDVLAEQRSPDAALSPARIHVPPRLVGHDARTGSSFDAGFRDGPTANLGDHEVGAKLEPVGALQFLAHVGGGRPVRDAVVRVGGGGQGGHRLVVGIVVARAPERETRYVGRGGQVQGAARSRGRHDASPLAGGTIG